MRSQWLVGAITIGLVASLGSITSDMAPASPQAGLRAALTFHASFDGSVNAAFGAGDKTLYSAASFARRQESTAGLPASAEIQHVQGQGRFGDALRFTTRRKPAVFFKADRNVAYRNANWSGTASFWLSVDPAGELETGFCDPIQITPFAWNNAAFFVEFEKTPTAIPFRLGVYADPGVWNPSNRRFEDIPDGERPLVTVGTHPFGKGRWTHVAFTFDRFNTGQRDGVATLYLDGRRVGALADRQQTFTWPPDLAAVNLGASYIGAMDEIAFFNRALSDDEIRALYELPKGVAALAP
jgi:hypothetical protein